MPFLNLPYHQDSAVLFSEIAKGEWPIWLDSGEGYEGHHLDIMAANPCHQLIFNQEHSNLQDCFSVIENTLAKHADSEAFGPGWFGFLSYDLFDQFEHIQKRIKKNLIPELVLGFYDVTLVVDHQQQQTRLHYLETAKSKAENVAEQLSNLTNAIVQSAIFTLTGKFAPLTSKAHYQTQFAKVKQYILDGDCYQVNLTQQFTAPCKGDAVNAYLKLRKQHSSPMSAFFKTDDFEILSLSPERFIKSEENALTTHPIKGTRPRGTTQASDLENKRELQQSEKDRAENVMIVDLLRNDLGRVCKTGSVVTEKLFDIESFPNVHHLVSTVKGELDPSKSLFEIFKAVFPGGSITGAPKVRSMEIIEELEEHRRSIYCGSFVYLGCNGNIDSNIAIRTLLKSNNEIHCWGGGGIVADSDCEKEYQETWDKVGKLMGILEEQFLDQ